MAMENQDRIQQLEQMGLDLHQAWMGKVCAWDPVVAMQAAMPVDLLPESRSMFNDLLRMNQSWLQMVDHWGTLLDSGMPWHWNAMGSDQIDLPENHILDSRSPNIPPSSRPGHQTANAKPPVTAPFKQAVRQPAAEAMENPGALQSKSKPTPPALEKKKAIPTTEKEGSPHKPIPQTPDSPKKDTPFSPAERHEGGKTADQFREEPQVTFRRLDDFAAMFRPGKDQEDQISNGNTQSPIVSNGDQNAVATHSDSTLFSPKKKGNEAPETISSSSSLLSPGKKVNAKAKENKSVSRSKNTFRTKTSLPKNPIADQKELSALVRQNPDSPTANANSLKRNPEQPSALQIPEWEQLQRDWNALSAPKTSNQPQKVAKNETSQASTRTLPATETMHVSAAPSSPTTTNGLKPVSSRYTVETRPSPDPIEIGFQKPRKAFEPKEFEIEEVMDQLVDQLQRDFKRYYGG
jgi:hypothetical protein